MAQLVVALAKMVLSGRRQLAELTATVHRTYGLDADAGLAAAMEDSRQQYNDGSKSFKHGQKRRAGQLGVKRAPIRTDIHGVN
eukprot:5817816-Pyramimonas_sp.AAC.1